MARNHELETINKVLNNFVKRHFLGKIKKTTLDSQTMAQLF